jgi:hypothetical protein
MARCFGTIREILRPELHVTKPKCNQKGICRYTSAGKNIGKVRRERQGMPKPKAEPFLTGQNYTGQETPIFVNY